jgi:hypothetical protein
MQEIHFLYLIASGNNDSVYKVGISVDPNARLRQIKATYRVPKAYIVETMDVNSRAEVFALEAALHARLEDRRTTRYGGREFFKLSQSDLEWLRNLYKDNTNDFAQAKAYYGLELTAADIRSKAQALEQERQARISHNRRHGKTYDTKPAGELKRYNDLKDKLTKGHLGERFEVKTYEHPSTALSNQIQAKASNIIAQNNSLNFLKVCAIGLASGAVVGAVKGSEATLSSAFTGGTIGLLSGTLSQVIRGNKERNKAKLLIESAIDTRYPSMRGSTMRALVDLRGCNSFLIRDYGESASTLRNKQPIQPSVDLPSQDKIYSTLENKSYFPKVATAITIGLTLGVSVGSSSSGPASFAERSNHSALEQASQIHESTGHPKSIRTDRQKNVNQEAGPKTNQRYVSTVEDPDLIHEEFKVDNASTLDKYHDKYYNVTGIVDNIKDEYIKLDSRTLFGGAVYCYYRNDAERNKAIALERNQALTLSGLLRLTPRSARRLRVDALDCGLNE